MTVNTAERLLYVIRTLNELGPCTVTDIRRKTGCSRQSVYRLLEVLQAHRYAIRLPDQPRFRLTTAIRELSDRVKDNDILDAIAAPVLWRLQSEVIWPTSLAVFDKGGMVIRHSTRDKSPFDFDNARVGERLSVVQTALGQTYMAFGTKQALRETLKIVRPRAARITRALTELLRKVRAQGYATRRGGHPKHTSSIAVPIISGGSLIAALAISFLSSAMTIDEAVRTLLGPLRAAAEEIGRLVDMQQTTAACRRRSNPVRKAS